MKCIYCDSSNTRVANSRPSKKHPQVWRRRTCEVCHNTFSTYELPAISEVISVKDLADGKVYPFIPAELTLSISSCFEHRSDISAEEYQWLVDTVSQKLLKQPRKEITNHELSELAYATLQRFDPLAAIQYGLKHKLVTGVPKKGRK